MMRHGLIASPIALLLALVCARAGFTAPAILFSVIAIAVLALGVFSEASAK